MFTGQQCWVVKIQLTQSTLALSISQNVCSSHWHYLQLLIKLMTYKGIIRTLRFQILLTQKKATLCNALDDKHCNFIGIFIAKHTKFMKNTHHIKGKSRDLLQSYFSIIQKKYCDNLNVMTLLSVYRLSHTIVTLTNLC